MEQHHISEGFQMVNWIRNSIVTLKLGELEVLWDRLLHDLDGKWWVDAEVVISGRSCMAELLNLLAHFSKLLIEDIISIMDLKVWRT